jgi:23S rRNA pseudouridine1911/1915/1917 synthase
MVRIPTGASQAPSASRSPSAHGTTHSRERSPRLRVVCRTGPATLRSAPGAAARRRTLKSSLSILHRDEHLLVVSKPAGVLSVPVPDGAGPSLPELLAREGFRVRPVHRLDRDVSGVVLFALDPQTQAGLEQQFRERTVEKTYWALAQGRVRPADGAFHFPILEEGTYARVSALGKKSVTRYRTLEALPRTTVVEVDLVTGRYNQIRVHFAHAGFPLVGERKYARGKDSPVRIASRRVALHSWRVALLHPSNGTRLVIEAPLPEDLRELVERASRP